MRKQRSRPFEGRPLSERLSLDGHSCEKKAKDYDEAAGKSTPGAKAKGGRNVSAR
jgi:hypothetical protein